MARKSRGEPAPPWALPAALVIVVAVVGLIAWRTLGHNSADAGGPPVHVQPGQFTIKKALESGTLGGPPAHLHDVH